MVEESTPSEAVSLLCPITRMRQTLPVRTDSCQHTATFDLEGMVRALKIYEICSLYRSMGPPPSDANWVPPPGASAGMVLNSTMACPICKSENKLYVDEKFEQFLRHHPDSQELTFTASGDAIPHVAPTNVSVVDITSPASATPLDIPLRVTPRGQRLVSTACLV